MQTLRPADLALHRTLGIDADLLAQQQVRRIDSQEARDLLGLNGRGGDLQGVVYPYIWPGSSRPLTYRVRRDHPEIEGGKPKNKYLSAYGDRRHLYLACHDGKSLLDPTIPIVVAEAEKSVLAITCAAARLGRQVLALGLGGCWGWRGRIGKVETPNGSRVDEMGPIGDLDRIMWTNRDVVLAFDANVATNPKVQAARRAFAAELRRRGAVVRILALPADAGINGPDDDIGRHGDATFFARIDAAQAVNDLLPPPSNPMAVARTFVEAQCTTRHGLVLHDHRGDFYRWDGTCWPENDKLDVRRELYQYVEHARYLDTSTKVPTVKPLAPTVRKVNDLVDALRACVGLPTFLEPPFWTDPTNELPNAHEMIPLQNGLLHLPTRILYPHTATYFGHHALAYPYLGEAPDPTSWLAFLKQLWPKDDADDEASSISVLQEVFGYIIGGATNLQKILLFVGPKRGGKGTIGRVLTGLLGKHNVAAPTLASLATNFGLSPLIGKPLALVSDARLSTKADSQIVVERLLSISGEDSLTIDRKYREPWTGRLPSRFLVLTNELPRLHDASGALASRFIMFVLTKSFYGLENPKLTEELLKEAPSILTWALEGLKRLNQRGHFVPPKSGADAIRQLEDLSSPITAFVRDRCAVEHDAEVDVEALWAAWKQWCEDENRHPGTKSVFFRDLHAGVPTIRQSKRSKDETRKRIYTGITVKKTPDIPDGDDEDNPGCPGCPGSSPLYRSRDDENEDEEGDRGLF